MSFETPTPEGQGEGPKKRTPEELAKFLAEPENLSEKKLDEIMGEVSEQFETWTDEQREKVVEGMKTRVDDLVSTFCETTEKNLDTLEKKFDALNLTWSNIIESNPSYKKSVDEMAEEKKLIDARFEEFLAAKELFKNTKFTDYDKFREDALNLPKGIEPIVSAIAQLGKKQNELVLTIGASIITKETNSSREKPEGSTETPEDFSEMYKRKVADLSRRSGLSEEELRRIASNALKGMGDTIEKGQKEPEQNKDAKSIEEGLRRIASNALMDIDGVVERTPEGLRKVPETLLKIENDFLSSTKNVLDSDPVCRQKADELIELTRTANDRIAAIYENFKKEAKKLTIDSPNVAEKVYKGITEAHEAANAIIDDIAKKLEALSDLLKNNLDRQSKRQDTQPEKPLTNEARIGEKTEPKRTKSLPQTPQRQSDATRERFEQPASSAEETTIHGSRDTSIDWDEVHRTASDPETKKLFEEAHQAKTIEEAFNVFHKAHSKFEAEGGRSFSKHEKAIEAIKNAALTRMRQVSGLSNGELMMIENGNMSFKKESDRGTEYKRFYDLIRNLSKRRWGAL
jgi:hypothetical protein